MLQNPVWPTSSHAVDRADGVLFTPRVTRHVPSRLFRLLCALAVAFVTTFHVCGIATAAAYPPTAMQAPETDGASQDEASLPGEKCHICATLSLPALMPIEDASPDSIAVRQVPVRNLLSFQNSLAPPPPRA
ncbi:hypothetical protein [Reyranella sp.]|uniref:hypothetical protein n=1 Tax=Reyranella sp. TaxID=1929291 RepID=UPI003BAC1D76